MSVRDNVAFGLEARGIGRVRRRARADELLELVSLGDEGGKRPDELSGGQRQRVAVARALAVEPAVLLLDEPLSALDLKLRQHMRGELRAIQRRTGVTFVYITHDQGEALAMSDRIAVMRAGRVEQVGTGDAIYSEPETAFVATFVGEQNRLRGRVVDAADGLATVDTAAGRIVGTNRAALATGHAATVLVRPERIGVLAAVGTAARPGAVAPDNAIPIDNAIDNATDNAPYNAIEATIERRELEGSIVNLGFRIAADGGASLDVQVHNTGDAQAFAPGQRHRLGFRARDALVMAADA